MTYEIHYLEDLVPQLPHCQERAKLTFYIPHISKEINTDIAFPCVLLCPGGGYWWTSEREAEPVALRLLGQGIAVFVLDYSCHGEHFPNQLLEASASIAYIRRHAKDLHVKEDSIYIMGFSAGGHLACSAGLLYKEDFIQKTLNLSGKENRPDGMILAYPVITSGPFAHKDSFKCLLGENADNEMLEKMSLEKRVTEDSPAAFIYHTAEDDLVPVENSLLLAQALSEKKVPFELHIFPRGGHGSSLCDENVSKKEDISPALKYNSVWVDLAIKWIKERLTK